MNNIGYETIHGLISVINLTELHNLHFIKFIQTQANICRILGKTRKITKVEILTSRKSVNFCFTVMRLISVY